MKRQSARYSDSGGLNKRRNNGGSQSYNNGDDSITPSTMQNLQSVSSASSSPYLSETTDDGSMQAPGQMVTTATNHNIFNTQPESAIGFAMNNFRELQFNGNGRRQTSSNEQCGLQPRLPPNLDSLPKIDYFPVRKERWNTNEEILALLLNFSKHEEWQTNDVVIRPFSGSMLMYSRKKVRYRRDGYCWKKRKDGKTTREDHMKLKVQGVECIYGCYVHSAVLATFHRRCYWLLENPDIVIVHYLNVPYPDDTKLTGTIPNIALCVEAREWTKEELLQQLEPIYEYNPQDYRLFYSQRVKTRRAIIVANHIEMVVGEIMEKQKVLFANNSLTQSSSGSGRRGSANNYPQSLKKCATLGTRRSARGHASTLSALCSLNYALQKLTCTTTVTTSFALMPTSVAVVTSTYEQQSESSRADQDELSERTEKDSNLATPVPSIGNGCSTNNSCDFFLNEIVHFRQQESEENLHDMLYDAEVFDDIDTEITQDDDIVEQLFSNIQEESSQQTYYSLAESDELSQRQLQQQSHSSANNQLLNEANIDPVTSPASIVNSCDETGGGHSSVLDQTTQQQEQSSKEMFYDTVVVPVDSDVKTSLFLSNIKQQIPAHQSYRQQVDRDQFSQQQLQQTLCSINEQNSITSPGSVSSSCDGVGGQDFVLDKSVQRPKQSTEEMFYGAIIVHDSGISASPFPMNIEPQIAQQPSSYCSQAKQDRISEQIQHSPYRFNQANNELSGSLPSRRSNHNSTSKAVPVTTTTGMKLTHPTGKQPATTTKTQPSSQRCLPTETDVGRSTREQLPKIVPCQGCQMKRYTVCSRPQGDANHELSEANLVTSLTSVVSSCDEVGSQDFILNGCGHHQEEQDAKDIFYDAVVVQDNGIAGFSFSSNIEQQQTVQQSYYSEIAQNQFDSQRLRQLSCSRNQADNKLILKGNEMPATIKSPASIVYSSRGGGESYDFALSQTGQQEQDMGEILHNSFGSLDIARTAVVSQDDIAEQLFPNIEQHQMIPSVQQSTYTENMQNQFGQQQLMQFLPTDQSDKFDSVASASVANTQSNDDSRDLSSTVQPQQMQDKKDTIYDELEILNNSDTADSERNEIRGHSFPSIEQRVTKLPTYERSCFVEEQVQPNTQQQHLPPFKYPIRHADSNKFANVQNNRSFLSNSSLNEFHFEHRNSGSEQ